MAKRDYYQVLGVSKTAGDAEIKKAYRRLAMKYHPDRSAGDEADVEKFKEAKEAYEILSTQQKRAAYDQYGHAGVDNSAGGAGGFSGQGNFGDIFGDVFGDIFGRTNGGGGGGSNRVRRGADLRYNMELDLEEAVSGKSSKIRVPTMVVCLACQGSGAKKGTKANLCKMCGGHGQVRMQQGFFSIQQTCPTCHGEGKVVSDPCRNCNGNGRVQEPKTLSVKIPPGVDTGDRIRLSGEGEAGELGGPAGDLYVHVVVKEHQIFSRDGSNLFCEVPISFCKAALGGELDVPTIERKVKLKIPPETQSGSLFRLRGKGVKPVRGGPVGDLICRVKVETPVNLTAEQKDILTKFDASLDDGGKRHSPQAHSWLDGVKNFFEKIVTG